MFRESPLPEDLLGDLCRETDRIVREQRKNPGIRKRFWGRMWSRERKRLRERAPIQIRPLQKPMAKLLYQSTRGGRGQRYLLSSAGSISANRVKLVKREVRKLFRKPVWDEVIPVSSSVDSDLVFSEERQVLKNRPVNRPVRNRNSSMEPSFRIGRSPFIVWFIITICSLSF